MKHLWILLTLVACSGTPGTAPGDAGVAGSSSSDGGTTGAGGTTSSCIVPAWANTIGELPAALPNQTPPGFIVAIVGDGSPNLKVTYQTTTGIATTSIITAGDASGIGITGSWQQDGVITSVTANANGGSFTINSSVFTVTGASVAGRSVWSGLNSGVGQIVGNGNVLTFAGYNASGIQRGTLVFTGNCTITASMVN